MNSQPSPEFGVTWRARPIFVSSTFRDMHMERDYLRDHAFLRLVERLRQRCHYLDVVDLRQGVESAHLADDAERELQVLQVCLDEIDRTRPFLVAFLGDRYGWVPPADRIVAAARTAGLPESLDVAGKSVTELEILYGLLKNEGQARRSWFYFRTVDRASMPPEIAVRFPAEAPSADADSPAAKLHALKDRIRQQLPERVRDYTLRWDGEKQELVGLAELDDRVEQDLWSDLDSETAAYLRETPAKWQVADARAVNDFVAECLRGDVERLAVSTPMLHHALSPVTPGADWGMAIIGEPGSGKSSLFGNVFRHLQQRAAAGEILLLSHATGTFPLSGQVDRLLCRWVGELSLYLGVEDPLAGWQESRAKAAALKQKINDMGIIVIDAARGADDLLNGLLGEISDVHANLISSEEIERFFARFLIDAADKIRVVVLIDGLDQFEATNRASQLTWMPKSWPENARMLATANPGSIGARVQSQSGFCEIAIPPVSLDEARSISEAFCRERYHRGVNPRVIAALLDKKVAGCPAHESPVWLSAALQELNLLEADDYDRADREFPHLNGAARMEALQLTWVAGISEDVLEVYGELLDRAERLYGKDWARTISNLIALSRTGLREGDLRRLVPLACGKDWDDLAFAGLRRTLGKHITLNGAHSQWDFSGDILRQAVLRRNLASEDERRRLHGAIVDHLEELAEWDILRQSELMVHLVGHGDRDRAANYLSWLYEQKHYGPEVRSALIGAVAALVDAIRVAPDEYSRASVTSWIVSFLEGDNVERSGNVAHVFVSYLNESLEETGALEEVRSRLLDATSRILRHLVATNPNNVNLHRDLADCIYAKGDILSAHGNWDEALGDYQEASDLLKRFLEAEPRDTDGQFRLSCYLEKMGDIFKGKGDGPGAGSAYEESLAIRERLFQIDSKNTNWMRHLAISLSKVGQLLLCCGGLNEALEILQTSLAVCELLAEKDPSNLLWQQDLSRVQDNIGDVLRFQGDIDGATSAYHDSMEIAKRLAESDFHNEDYQRDLSISYEKVGDMLRESGRMGGALDAYREGLVIAERLSQADPNNVDMKRDLVVMFVKMAQFNEDSDQSQALIWWRKAHVTLTDIKQSGQSQLIDEMRLKHVNRIIGRS